MLERLADHDDALMEQLLEDVQPPRDKIFADLAAELRAGQIVPVFIGSALNGNGIFRLLKALRHEAPNVEDTRKRLGIADDRQTIVQVLKTIHTSHAGKLSLARVLSGRVEEAMELLQSARRNRKSLGHLPDGRAEIGEARRGRRRRDGGARQDRAGAHRRHAHRKGRQGRRRSPFRRLRRRCSARSCAPPSARTK